MTFDDFYQSVLEILPDAEIGEDNDGQLVIYTGLRAGNGDTVEEFEAE